MSTADVPWAAHVMARPKRTSDPVTVAPTLQSITPPRVARLRPDGFAIMAWTLVDNVLPCRVA